MPISKFEKRALNQINQLNEGLALSLFKFFFKAKVKKSLKGMANDPEFKATTDALDYHAKELKRQIRHFEKTYGKKPELWDI
jgi:hypothetical protein